MTIHLALFLNRCDSIYKYDVSSFIKTYFSNRFLKFLWVSYFLWFWESPLHKERERDTSYVRCAQRLLVLLLRVKIILSWETDVHESQRTTKIIVWGAIITLFLPPGFSRVLACKTRQPDWVEFDPRVVQMHQEALKRWPRAHFVRFGKIWLMLTKFDQSWPELTKLDRSLTKTMTKPKSRLDWPFSDHWKEYTTHSIRHFTGQKQRRNKEVMGKTAKIGSILNQIWLSIIDQNRPILGQCSCTESSWLATSWSASLKL